MRSNVWEMSSPIKDRENPHVTSQIIEMRVTSQIIEMRVTYYEDFIYLCSGDVNSVHWSASTVSNLIIQP